MIYIILSVSILANVILALYIRYLIKNLLFYSENISELWSAVSGLSKHLANLHEMEMFYGEPIIQNLVLHCSEVREIIDDFGELILEEDAPTGEEAFGTNKEETEEKEEQLFYQRS